MKKRYSISREDLLADSGIKPNVSKLDDVKLKKPTFKKVAKILSDIYKETTVKGIKK